MPTSEVARAVPAPSAALALVARRPSRIPEVGPLCLERALASTFRQLAREMMRRRTGCLDEARQQKVMVTATQKVTK